MEREKGGYGVRGGMKFLFGVSIVFLLTFLVLRLTYEEPFERVPFSTAVFDREGSLLGAHVADDGQWRFELSDSLPAKYLTCLLAFEDRHFYSHPGVNPIALVRALIQNIKAGKVVSGGSTISMQVIRLSRNRPRTIGQKIIEMILAIQLEISTKKHEVLRLYASQAPYGGNVVGLEAASWRYFGRSPYDLSWSEAATLAVLPNSPALIHPGRNRDALKEKRDRLLTYLLKEEVLDSMDYDLALAETLPLEPLDLPRRANHLVDYYANLDSARVDSRIIPWLQDQVVFIGEKHQKVLRANHVYNMAVLVLDNESGDIVAYMGNAQDDGTGMHGHQVDIIHRGRSSGSILKPILYASMLDAGEILPGTLVPDIPTRIAGFTPHNFNKEYDGAVHADDALIRSLNVPAVRMLRQYGIVRFYDQLKDLRVSTLHRRADDYGLSLILGGAEVSLWDICHIYSGWANDLSHHKDASISNAAVYLTFEAMKQVKRPESESGWQYFQSAKNLAWKTGTSFGFRDAWAVGVNPNYTIGVWVGNADGEGRPGLTGSSVAAPVLFDIANLLPQTDWFEEPLKGVVPIEICRESGMRASANCVHVDTLWLPEISYQTALCPYHIRIALDQQGQYRVHGDCYPVEKIQFENWFVLSPSIAHYYSKKNPLYKPLPPWYSGCSSRGDRPIEILYPHPDEELYVPLNAAGERENILFEVVHQIPETKVYWFLDDSYVGSTEGIHKMGLKPEAGSHNFTVMDGEGNIAERIILVR